MHLRQTHGAKANPHRATGHMGLGGGAVAAKSPQKRGQIFHHKKPTRQPQRYFFSLERAPKPHKGRFEGARFPQVQRHFQDQDLLLDSRQRRHPHFLDTFRTAGGRLQAGGRRPGSSAPLTPAVPCIAPMSVASSALPWASAVCYKGRPGETRGRGFACMGVYVSVR